MKTFSCRDVLKTSLLAPAVAATAHALGPIDPAVHAAASEVSGPLSAPTSLASPKPGAGRERLLLDFGWSFHLGNADDPAGLWLRQCFGWKLSRRFALAEQSFRS
jgi:beta-galactosidase